MPNRTSSRVLILANLLPLVGVLLFDWDVLVLLLLYWAESVVIGVLNVLRILCCQTDDFLRGMDKFTDMAQVEQMNRWFGKIPLNALKVFIVPFFIFHFGAFCYAHLRILFSIFSSGSPSLYSAFSLLDYVQSAFWITVAVVFCSHLFSFFKNYIGNGEYERASMPQLIFWPYGRIFVMQVVVIFGAILVISMRSPMPMLLLLIAIKISIDVYLHEKERGNFSPVLVPQT